jgi:hypothetical protein
VEGDSLILVNIALRHLLNGTKLEKITRNWRLTIGWESILHSINQILVIIPLHVRRKAIYLVDKLANEGENSKPWDLEVN